MDMSNLPYYFYIAGSICFLIGSIIAMKGN
jgi:hypothetical protein